MRERPILFSGPMVRAILEGRKTQTRRVAMVTRCGVRVPALGCDPAPDAARCPYGVPGDRLWVRETWYDNLTARSPEQRASREEVYYRADGLPEFEGEESEIRWRPSIHMPRWTSRLTLTITDVRVERLQDITEADAQAEGIETYAGYARERFRDLWNNLNRSRGFGWDVNPWVWAIGFTTTGEGARGTA